MKVNATLVYEARLNCGGGKLHECVQITSAYEFAVARYNHPRAKNIDQIQVEIERFESMLYQMGRKK